MKIEDYKVGDVLYAKGGYNRTDVEFYEITKMTEKRMEITLLKSKVVSGDPCRTYYVEPTTNKTDKVEKAYIKGEKYLCILGRTLPFSIYMLYKYEGKPIWANTGYQCKN